MAVKKTRRLSLGGSSALSSEKEFAQHIEPVIIVTAAGSPDVKQRKGMLRKLEAENILKLMTSLAKGDKLPPIGKSQDGHLVFGNHRITAAQLLATPPTERHKALPSKLLNQPLTAEQRQTLESFAAVPSVELRVDMVDDPEAEIRENTHRRQLTPQLVREQLDLPISFGYEEGSGRPSKDSKGKAMAKLAELWSITPRALQQHLQHLNQPKAQKKPTPTKQDDAERARVRLRSALTYFLETNGSKKTQSAKETLALAEKLASRLDS